MIIDRVRNNAVFDLSKPRIKPRASGKAKPSAWTVMRDNHLKTYPECRICEQDRDVVVHHLRYRGKRGASEQPGDLVTLCRRHHDALHRVVGPGSAFVPDAVRKSLEWLKTERFNYLDDLYRDSMDS